MKSIKSIASIKSILAVLTVATLCGCSRDLASYVDPLVGTDLHGHTTPAAIVPFGMVQPGPDTRIEGWDGCSGYHYSSDTIYGFSQTHLSGTGCDDYCDVLLMPVNLDGDSCPSSVVRADYLSTFSHRREKAEAGYYKVHMDNGITAELTASRRVAWHRYDFGQSNTSHGIIIDLTHRDKLISGGFDRPERHTPGAPGLFEPLIAGWRESSSWNPGQKLWFTINGDTGPLEITYYGRDGRLLSPNDSAERVKACLHFPSDRRVVTIKVSLSSVSAAGAAGNMTTDTARWFDAARRMARAEWDEALGKIVLKNALRDDMKRFYTALYHCMTSPYLYSDADGCYRGVDDQIHHVENRADGSPHELYTVFSLWDTYRALHPLLTILEPRRTEDFVYTMLQHYLQGGELTMWELWGHETHCMIGYHAAPVILDAYNDRHILANWDSLMVDSTRTRLQALLDGMLATANRTEAQRHYAEDGYLSAQYDNESVSKTLEYAYDDWCIAQFALAACDRHDIYRQYMRRSQSWKNVIDDAGFMHPRRNGAFVTPFDPAEVNNHFTEANSWQYSTYVPHDVYGWIEAVCGTAAAHAKLDSLFFGTSQLSGRNQSDITGLIGQYAHGNEPSHHAAYLFSYVGSHKKTDGLVHLIRSRLYAAEPYGLCGNEDCGQMSAWYVLSSLGLYPVCPGSGEWVLTTPLFHHAQINAPYNTIKIDRKEWPAGKFLTLNSLPSVAGHTTRTTSDSSSIRLPAANLITPTPRLSRHIEQFSDSIAVTITMPHWYPAFIYYTTDGTTPDTGATTYTAPISINHDQALKAVAYNPQTGYSNVVTARYTKFRKDKKLTYVTTPEPMYSEGGADALIDNIHGTDNFRLGGWQGWKGDMQVVIDLLEMKSIKNVSICCLQDMRAWVFFPSWVSVATSVDGAHYEKPAIVDSTSCRILGSRTMSEQEHRQTTIINIPVNSRARYLAITAKNYGPLPSWHVSSGEQSWLFCSEIIVSE